MTELAEEPGTSSLPNPQTNSLKLDSKLFLTTPPPLDPAWLLHEKEANLLSPPTSTTSTTSTTTTDLLKSYQKIYSKTCKERNAHLLSTRDQHLTHGLKIHDTQISATDGHNIPIRSYNPSGLENGPPVPSTRVRRQILEPDFVEIGGEGGEGKPIVIYYHGGGLKVGDLDSEDLSCRRICKELCCTVYSVEYRLMPDFTADRAVKDAMEAFIGISNLRKASRLILVGSSSGGQLAAQVSQLYGTMRRPQLIGKRIHGVLLRCPVTCDATDGGVNIPERFKELHKSMSPDFYTSLQSAPALDTSNRTKEHLLPLEAIDFSRLPRAFIQVTTNDVYYSDGICYAAALMEAGVDVKLDIVEGWPHTFWLKAPLLERAVRAERRMIEGLRWLLEAEIADDVVVTTHKATEENFKAMDPMEFERKFDHF